MGIRSSLGVSAESSAIGWKANMREARNSQKRNIDPSDSCLCRRGKTKAVIAIERLALTARMMPIWGVWMSAGSTRLDAALTERPSPPKSLLVNANSGNMASHENMTRLATASQICP